MADLKHRQKIGQLGERLAIRYLQEKGFTLIEANYWRPYGEIDLVMKNRGVYHFVEVKTVIRENNLPVSQITLNGFRAEDNLHPLKLRRVERACVDYAEKARIAEANWQIDAVAVYLSLSKKVAKCIYLPNIC